MKTTKNLIIFIILIWIIFVSYKCFGSGIVKISGETHINKFDQLEEEKENIHQIYNNRGNYNKDISITVIHDDKRFVTCWTAQNQRGEEISISCLPDRYLP